MFDIHKFIDKDHLASLGRAGMHKVATRLEKLESGRDIGDEMDMHSAISLLGEKAFIKRAEHRMIRSSLAALNQLPTESFVKKAYKTKMDTAAESTKAAFGGGKSSGGGFFSGLGDKIKSIVGEPIRGNEGSGNTASFRGNLSGG